MNAWNVEEIGFAFWPSRAFYSTFDTTEKDKLEKTLFTTHAFSTFHFPAQFKNIRFVVLFVRVDGMKRREMKLDFGLSEKLE